MDEQQLQVTAEEVQCKIPAHLQRVVIFEHLLKFGIFKIMRLQDGFMICKVQYKLFIGYP